MLNYYEDMSPYQYEMSSPATEVKNVGWLDKAHPFTKGEVKSNVLDKLRGLIFSSKGSSCNIIVNKLRGSYECPVCGEYGLKIADEQREFSLGSAEIWIPDSTAHDHYFATFGLIIHYIEAHNYQPPQEFIDSILALDVKDEFDGQAIRDRLDRKYAGRN